MGADENEPVRLDVDDDGLVACPRRGQISAEWCEGCPRRVSIDGPAGEPHVVECVPDATHPPPASAWPLEEPPDLGQVR